MVSCRLRMGGGRDGQLGDEVDGTCDSGGIRWYKHMGF